MLSLVIPVYRNEANCRAFFAQWQCCKPTLICLLKLYSW